MKKSLLLAAAILFTTGSAFAASTFSAPLNGSAFLNNGTVNLNVSLTKSNMDCGTINYTAAAPFAAGSACPSGPNIANAIATVSGNASFTPYYITLTDVGSSLANQCVLANGANTFSLNLAISIDGVAYSSGYYTPTTASNTITITPSTRAAAAAQAVGRYTGTTTFFISF